ncbi:MAG TPA: DUF1003 domain-containing protein [Pyrinomonadaceae bacterium]|jgi:uncharacterized membrane protein|nr:DUF1003 domain-containing protein [Pyrinomonadaceae bacterium]
MSTQAISQNEIIRKNIAAISEMQRKDVDARKPQERISDSITRFSGSTAFVFIHVVWFGLWILLNVNLIHLPHVSEFDPFPFGLLTMIVSLEAIFLSTFVLISQNRMSALSEKRAELDLQVNMLAEQKAAKTLELLEHVAQQLDAVYDRFNYKTDPEIEALKVSPKPHEVLQVMEDAVREEAKQAAREIKEEVRKDITGEVEAAVRDVTGEVDAVRDDVESVDEKVKRVASDVREVKEEMKVSATARG